VNHVTSTKPLTDNAVAYTADWVVYKLMKILDYNDSRFSLVTTEMPGNLSSRYHLLTLINDGCLAVPSMKVLKVRQTAEKVL
jgi:hypothetical protein